MTDTTAQSDDQAPTRESMAFDVVVVGAGPAGLAAAIRLKQLAQDAARDITVCVLEKGAAVGAHVLSGAVIDPIALDELIPDWRDRGAPLDQPVTRDVLMALSATGAYKLPTPPGLKNRGCYVGSLGALTRWLGEEAERLGVEIYPGFAATEVLFDDLGRVKGVATGDMGRTKGGRPGPNFEPGVELHATQTLFAEGCRGQLSEQLMAHFDLRDGVEPQTYALGVKEVWEIAPEHHKPGLVVHSMGWPLPRDVYGGGFLYHYGDNLLAVGLITGLDYANPYLSPFEEMQRFKTHPKIKPLFQGAKRIAYGARALNEGGWQAVPRLTFPGGALIGAAAGFMNVARLKGSHTAMKSAIAAAEAAFADFDVDTPQVELSAYPQTLKNSWVMGELFAARNIRPAFRLGLLRGLAYAALDTYVLRGQAPWTFRHVRDHETFRHATKRDDIAYPSPDGHVTFDRLSSVALANTAHGEDQPVHLKLADPDAAVNVNLILYDGPEARYCPASVYEFVPDGHGGTKLQINAANCIHCKTCDILDPRQNITWTAPEGGSGPQYVDM